MGMWMPNTFLIAERNKIKKRERLEIPGMQQDTKSLLGLVLCFVNKGVIISVDYCCTAVLAVC